MAKKDGKKKNPGTRNADRKNGKAWSKKKLDARGRALTGRGKPTHRTIKGQKIHGWDCTCNTCKRVIDLTRVSTAA